MREAIIGTLAALVATLLVASSASAMHMGMTTGFTVEDSAVSGTFVSFEFDETSGTISNYALSSGDDGGTTVTVFTSVTIENFSTEFAPMDGAQIYAMGAMFTALGAYASVRAIDNPAGNLAIANVGLLGGGTDFDGDVGGIGDMQMMEQYVDAQNTVEFTLDPALEATFEGGQPGTGGGFVNITGDNFRGFIFVSGGSIEVVNDVITVKLKGPQATFFHGLPLLGMIAAEEMFESEMAESAAEGHVGARIELGLETSGQVRMVTTPFRTSFQVSVQTAMQNKVSLDLTSSQPEGAIVVVVIGNDLIELDKEIRVLLDGNGVEQAASLELLVQAKSQGTAQPMVYLLKTSDSLKLSIYVPGFSTKTLTVETVEPAPGETTIGDLLSGSALWIVVGIAAVIIILGAIAAVRRRG
ncbi:MAG: hypothetical protein ACE5HJ_00530 [Thermoplasmata archaeon]